MHLSAGEHGGQLPVLRRDDLQRPRYRELHGQLLLHRCLRRRELPDVRDELLQLPHLSFLLRRHHVQRSFDRRQLRPGHRLLQLHLELRGGQLRNLRAGSLRLARLHLVPGGHDLRRARHLQRFRHLRLQSGRDGLGVRELSARVLRSELHRL